MIYNVFLSTGHPFKQYSSLFSYSDVILIYLFYPIIPAKSNIKSINLLWKQYVNFGVKNCVMWNVSCKLITC